jgi:4-amino-4-deoxy-L-arabinose transferase-like glycosyltransferase
MAFKEETQDFAKLWRLELIILAVAMIVRIVYFSLMTGQLIDAAIIHSLDDSRTYVNIARYILGTYAAGESDLLLAGPGYGLFLATLFKIFGFTSWPILILQSIFSSLSAVLIFRIAMILFKERPISLIAGLIAAVSATSFSLAVAILSDSLFFFLLVFSIYLFLRGLETSQWKYFISTGILIGLATLVRSVGLFFPVVLLIIAFLFSHNLLRNRRKLLLIRTILTGAIIIVIAFGWSFRNLIRHDIFTVSETGALASKHYLSARIIYEANKNRRLIEIRDELAAPLEINGRPATPKETHDDALATARRTIAEHPGTFIYVMLLNIYENISMQNTLHAVQLPDYKDFFTWWTDHTTRKGKSFIIPLLTILGFIVLTRKGYLRPVLILASIYLYFALLSGVTFWQGSRVFYPGQLAWAVFVSAGLIQIYQFISGVSKRQKIKPENTGEQN